MSIQQVPNLIQGASQQAPQQRRDTQCEAQFDCLNSVTDGAAARPPTEVVKLWAGRTLTGAFFEELERAGENYLLGVYDEQPFAINLDTGVDATIGGAAWPNVTGYLDAVVGLDAADQFRAQVVEDTVFVVNRRKAPLMDASSKSAALRPEAIFWAQSGRSNNATVVQLSGPGAVTSGSGSDDSFGLAAEHTTNINGTAGYTAQQSGSTFRVYREDNQDFTVFTRDKNGDQDLHGYKGYIPGLEKLPPRGFPGVRLEVRGESRTTYDNYWMEWQGPSSTGAWREVVAPDTEQALDADTMPHALVLTGVDAFDWKKNSWSTRIAGDKTTAPDPGFIGRMPRDLFYHKNRFGVLYDAGAVWSKAKYPFTMFPDTLQTVLANAPVDIKMAAAPTGRGSVTLDFPVQIDKTLTFWGQGTQFEITQGQDNFKQESVSADPSTSYEYGPRSRPYGLGKFLYFCSEAGPYATVYAIQYQQSRAAPEVSISDHIKNYIRSGVKRHTGSGPLGVIFTYSEGAPQALYVWNYLFDSQQFIQSAWNTWRIPGGNILWAGVRGNYLRILQQRPEGVALLRVNLTPKIVDAITGAYYLTRLDMRVTQAQVTSLSYNSGTGRTSFTLPYTPHTADGFKVVMAETVEGLSRGRVMPIVSIVGAVVTVTGDLSGGKKFYAGHTIVAERTESQFFVRTDKGPTPFDALTVNRFGVEVSGTGYTRIEVTGPDGDMKPYEYTGRTAGLPGSLTGPPLLGKTMHSAPVGIKSPDCKIRLVNDSFLPSYWQSAYFDYTGVGKGGIP